METRYYNLQQRPESPERMVRFRERLLHIQWTDKGQPEALDRLFTAVDELAEAEVYYYHRRRNTRAWISGTTRTVAWISGSIGLLLPLLAGAAMHWPFGEQQAQFGYVFLAIAASALTANTLFGGTAGHVRFVSTQLELERLITAARIQWCAYLSDPGPLAEAPDRGFKLIQAYATDLHRTTLAETGNWAGSTMEALTQFQSSLQAKTGKQEK